MRTVVANTDEEEMELESHIYLLRLDTSTFPSGTHGYPWKPAVILEGSTYSFLLWLLKSSLENVGCCF